MKNNTQKSATPLTLTTLNYFCITFPPLFPVFREWLVHHCFPFFRSENSEWHIQWMCHSLTGSGQWCQRVQPVKTNINIVQKHLTLNIQFTFFYFYRKNVVRTSKLIFIIVCLQKGPPLQEVKSNKMADIGAAILFLKMADIGAAILCLHVGHFVKPNRGFVIIWIF